jgi:hypothetical protein
MVFEAARVAVVIALIGGAALLATPPGKLPLALRGIRRMLRKDIGDNSREIEVKVPAWRRFVAFLLVMAAAALALLV